MEYSTLREPASILNETINDEDVSFIFLTYSFLDKTS
jgi:hypothetical protein